MVSTSRSGASIDGGSNARWIAACSAGSRGSAWARRDGVSRRRLLLRSNATAASTVQCTIRIWARSFSGSSLGRQTLSWKAASATVVTPARSSSSSTAKKTGSVRAVSSSPLAETKSGVVCTIPSLISSRQIAGQPRAAASRWASVVLPEPDGPLTTTRVGLPVLSNWQDPAVDALPVVVVE